MRQPIEDIAIIRDKSKARNLLKHILDSGHHHALDFETTGLDPKEAHVVLVSISGPAWTGVIDLYDCEVPLRYFKKQWEAGQWIVFNAGFELRFFTEHGCPDVLLHDVGYLRRAIMGGAHFSLANMALWDLKIEMEKELQASDWGADELSDEQYKYAVDDAIITYDLWKHWVAKATEDEKRGYLMLNNLVPAVIEMESAGITLDVEYHKTLIKMWKIRAGTSYKYIRQMVSEEEVPNLNSGIQIGNFLRTIMDDASINALPKTEKSGQIRLKRDDLTALSNIVPYPLSRWLAALACYKRAEKYVSSFGDTLIHHAENGGGRIHPRYNIAAAKTGRFSSSAPNAQNFPHAKTFRRSFVAGLGRVLVGGDLSGIEVRVLAAMSGDPQLWDDQVYGDVHRQVASVAFGVPVDKVTPEQRSKAKAITFMICYGGGATGLSIRLKTDTDTAQDYIDGWAERYPDAMNYRNEMHEQAQRTGFLDTAGGRSIYVGRKATLPVCANYPIQGSALDVMAHTIIAAKEYLDEAREEKRINPMTRLLATVHDELVVETTKKSAEYCEGIMMSAFEHGWTTVFPKHEIDNLFETGIGVNWAEIH